MRTFVPTLVLLLLLSGCARLQTFRVVDAQSGQPLDGVQAERLDGSVRPSAIPLVLADTLSPVERQAADPSGAVNFKKAGSQFAFNPRSGNPGYGRAFVAATWSGVKIRYPDEQREVPIKPIDGVVEVPLPKQGPGSKSSAAALPR
jgi:hypothetical protein